ncbi:MAG: flippase [Gemmatimonadota bacterium]|nr:MAG: flippase [Gemmatimonadota bacterium]
MRFDFITKPDAHFRELLQGASVAFVLKALAAGLTFGFNVLVGRTLGADGAGLYFLSLTVVTIATVFGRVGLDNAVLRHIATGAATSDWHSVQGVRRKALTLAFGASVVAGVATFLLAPWLSESLFSKPELTRPVRWMTLAVVPMVFVILQAEMLKGLKRIFASQLVHGVLVPGLALLGLYLLGTKYGVRGPIWAYTGAAVVSALVGLFFWWRSTPPFRIGGGHFPTRRLLDSSIPLFLVASTDLIMAWVGIFALGVWGTKADVGVFSMASRTALLISLVLIAVNTIAAPKFAALYGKSDMEALESTAVRSTWLMLAFASPVLILFLLIPGWVMGLFGPEFVVGAVPLMILALGQFVNVATGSVAYLLMMSGHERLVRNNVAAAAILNVILTVILVPIAGIVGAAIATAVSLAAKNLIAAYLVRSRLKVATLRIQMPQLAGRRNEPDEGNLEP